jgi:hypothetical protein
MVRPSLEEASPMNENRRVPAWSLLAMSAALAAPLATACGSNSTPPNTAAATTANAPMMGAPPAQGAYGAPPGYPQQQAVAPAGYPAQPGYPAATATAAPPGYPAAYPAATAAPPMAGQPMPAQPMPGQAAAAASASSTPLAPTDPNSLQGILAGLQGALQGTLVAPGSAMPTDLTEAGLKAQALRLAPGMQPEGNELKQNLPEGQHAVMMVTLQAGKCYSILGFSPLGGVKDLDLNLLAPPLYMTLAGQDLTHNNMPSIGGAPNAMCPVIAFPLQYKLDVFARSGSGQVAVQLYSKNK